MRQLEDTLAALRRDFTKLVSEHMDKYRATLVAKAAQDIAADMEKEARRAELELKQALVQREIDDNERIAKALAARDPEARQHKQA